MEHLVALDHSPPTRDSGRELRGGKQWEGFTVERIRMEKRSTEPPETIEITEIQVTKKEYERRQMSLIKALLEIEEKFRANQSKADQNVA